MNCMRFTRHRFSLVGPLMAILLVASTGVNAASLTRQEPSSGSSKPADNSARNKNQGTTADQQSNKTNDREITRKIRQSIIAEKSLSTYAHNVKIIVKDGSVTLKGPVRSEDEKNKVAELATQVVGGSDKVSNEVTVKP